MKRQKSKLIITILPLILCIIGMVIGNAQIIVEDRTIDSIGLIEPIEIILSNASQGVSGYNLTIELSDSSVATIISIEFPSWASINRNSTLPSSNLWFKAVDLTNEITEGTEDILLATVMVKGEGSGESLLMISNIKVDDDNGYPLYNDITNGTIQVAIDDSTNDNSDQSETSNSNSNSGSNDESQSEGILPIAICLHNYTGMVNSPIRFNASNSSDPDGGAIISWEWDFGDGSIGSGEITNHVYSYSGTYNGSLRVIDDENTSNLIDFIVSVSPVNRAPGIPSIQGTRSGFKNTSYTFEVQSIDPDDDALIYTIDWGDLSNVENSIYIKNGTSFISQHSWMKPGVYNITIIANDSKLSSQSIINISIDAKKIDGIGVLIDDNSDGIYDRIRSVDGFCTILKYDDGKYLINSNGDSDWDYIYSNTEGILSYENTEKTDENISIILIGVVISIGIVIMVVIFYKKV